jgi:putative spermidine/putrescine transport system ATP-binding protein
MAYPSTCAAVELVGVQRDYGRVAAVRDISLRVDRSQFVTLLGSSGSGKTTTLMMVAGFVEPSAGDIFIDGRRVNKLAPHKRDLGVVFQHYALFPHMTISENLAFPLRTRGLRGRDVRDRVDAALEMVNLSGYGGRRPAELSGGQQQRVALARALIFRPHVLLMDEPLGALDRKLRAQLQMEIKQIQKEQHVAVIYVTHDQDEALTMSDRIAVMNEGAIVQIGVPETIYERPATEFVATFVGETNLFRITEMNCGGPIALGKTDTGMVLPVSPLPDGMGCPATIAIRPERIRLGLSSSHLPNETRPRGVALQAVVRNVVYSGEVRRFLLDAGPQTVTVKLQPAPEMATIGEGDNVELRWEPADMCWLRK